MLLFFVGPGPVRLVALLLWTLVAVSYGNSFVVVFCWAWPRSSCCFVALETKRKSGWGICGSSLFVLLWFCVMICHFHRYRPIALCTAFFTAYVVIRTVPQSINGQTREKKRWCASLSSNRRTSVWPKLGCRNAKASHPPVTLQCPNSLPL